MGNRSRVLAEIGQSGFSPKGRPSERASGFPIRWSVVSGVIALWNVLFMLDRSAHSQSHEPGSLVLLALLALFFLATSIRASPRLQRIVLRNGHQVGEIKAFLALLQIVAGFLSIVFGGMWLAHGYAVEAAQKCEIALKVAQFVRRQRFLSTLVELIVCGSGRLLGNLS